jgi:hypothetical protein
MAEIYDQKAPLPGYRRTFDCRNKVRGITLMTPDELQKLSEMQVAFIGLEAQLPSYLARKSRMRTMRDDFVLQHYRDDEPEADSEATVGYHELNESEFET